MLRLMDPELEAAVLAQRLAAQGLTDPSATTPEAVVGRLLAVQAQDARGFRLAVRSRSTGLTSADVDRALTERRTLVVDWLNRGTLHLVAAEDHGWIHMLTAPRLRSENRRRLDQEGVSRAAAEDGVGVIASAVRLDGPQTREQLRGRLDAAGVPTRGQALVHVLAAASIAGHVLRGPVVDGRQAFVDAASWLGPHPPVTRDEALARLARRYLAGHGPAGPADLAAWAGIALGEARRGIQSIAAELADRPGDLVSLAAAELGAGLPAPRLLGPFDPVLHGWASRRLVVGDNDRLVASGGVFRPTALVRGRAVATWRLDGRTVQLRPFEPIAPAVLAALRADESDLARFLGPLPRPRRAASPRSRP